MVQSDSTYVCGFCGETRLKGSFCEPCRDTFSQRPPIPVDDIGARVAEVRLLLMSPLSVRFADLHKRLEDIIGRSVWTHEFADPQALIDEVLSGQSIGFAAVVDKLADRMPTTVLLVSSQAPQDEQREL